MSDFPLPSHAAHVWIIGDELYLGLPPLPGNSKGHTIHFKADERGISIILDILRSRSTSLRSYIGTRGSPVQYDIEQIKTIMAKKKAEKEADLEMDFLEEIGL
jgi:hypothetical protein